MNFVKLVLLCLLSCAMSHGMQQADVVQKTVQEKNFQLLLERFNKRNCSERGFRLEEIIWNANKDIVIFNCRDRLYIYKKNDTNNYKRQHKLQFFPVDSGTLAGALCCATTHDDSYICDVTISDDNELVVGTVERWGFYDTDDVGELYFFIYRLADKSYALVSLFNDETISCQAITKKSIFLGSANKSKLWIVPRDLKKNVLICDLPSYKKSKSILSKFVRSGRKGIDKFINLYVDTSKRYFDC